MPGAHTELAFEDAIEHHLVTEGGWLRGDPKAYDRKLALTPADLFAFLAASQPETWAAMQKQHGKDLEGLVLDAVERSLESQGTLHVLRRGVKVHGKKLEGAVFRPPHGMNPETLASYAANRLVVTRQVRFIDDAETSIDLLLSLNGFPIATAELKNHQTGQTVEHAVKQYRERDTRARLFQFKKRALVHFAVDPDVAFMTTHLTGASTRFLPFNRGRDGGAGNREHPAGHRTAYLWREVWQRDSFIDIVARFIHVLVEEETSVGKDGKARKVEREKMVFPRYHQLDVVRRLEDAARREGAGSSYLIQHSAGSGKSNSIAWLAHHLSTLHDEKDRKVFDSVVIITDRQVLDRQLQDNIWQFEQTPGVVQKIDEHSSQLAEALNTGKPIIVTTLQKFPFAVELIAKTKGKRYAVIVDEAHSSQTGEASRQMKEVLAAGSLEDAAAEDADAGGATAEDRVAEVMLSRGKQKNLSFFAFTATPKAKTLEAFGHRDAEGKPRPFHLYSMRQAIEERFILDVLQNYTTYKAYYRLVKAGEADPRVPKGEAVKQLARFMSLHPHNLAQKTEVMVEHFRAKVRPKIGGKAKAMVVTSSRLHAVRYRQEFDRYIKEKGYTDVGVLVAFSGTVKDPDTGLEFTEPQMNTKADGKRVSEAQLRGEFATDAFQILLVANKYQTGFDQPLLHTMYVDKRLAGVQAVQTLSRLNRTCAGKEDTFVLDFVNDADEVQAAFQPYYEETTVAESAEPQQLYDLSHQLEEAQVFWPSEVEAFARVFYAPKGSARDDGARHAEQQRHLNPAVDRFKALDDEKKDAFRGHLGAYVKLYAFLSQVMPFTDPDLEKLYTYCRHLETKLPRDGKRGPLDLDDDVVLGSYRLQKISEGAIPLKIAEPVGLRGPVEVGTRKAKDDEAALSEIIQVLNDRFGMNLAEADRLIVDAVELDAKATPGVKERAAANSKENFAISIESTLDDLFVDRLERDENLVKKVLGDPAVKKVVFAHIVERLYRGLRDAS